MKWADIIKFNRKKKPAPQAQVIFFSLSNLMLSEFISIVCDKELWRVVKSGKPTTEEIAAHWDKLFIEYCDGIGSEDYEIAVDREKQLTVLEAKINVVKSALIAIYDIWVKDIADMLNNEYGISIEYYPDAETYHKQFIRAEGRVKSWQVDLDIMQIKKPDNTEAKHITRETFSRIRIELGEFQGYPIKEHDTTTEEFKLLIRKLSDHNKALEARNRKQAA